MSVPERGGRDPLGRGIIWSYDKAKRGRQAGHILDYYLLSPEERRYLRDADRIHRSTGATSITFEPWEDY